MHRARFQTQYQKLKEKHQNFKSGSISSTSDVIQPLKSDATVEGDSVNSEQEMSMVTIALSQEPEKKKPRKKLNAGKNILNLLVLAIDNALNMIPLLRHTDGDYHVNKGCMNADTCFYDENRFGYDLEQRIPGNVRL